MHGINNYKSWVLGKQRQGVKVKRPTPTEHMVKWIQDHNSNVCLKNGRAHRGRHEDMINSAMITPRLIQL